MTQSEMILAALESGRRLTPLDALREFGCLRLGARVWDMRRDGHNVQREMVMISTGKRVARYWLPRPMHQQSLHFGGASAE